MAHLQLSSADRAAILENRRGKNWSQLLIGFEHEIVELKRTLEAKDVELASLKSQIAAHQSTSSQVTETLGLQYAENLSWLENSHLAKQRLWKAALDEAKGQPSAQQLSQLNALHRTHQEEIASQDTAHKAEVDKLLSQEALCREQVTDLTDRLDCLRSEMKDLSQDHRTDRQKIASRDASHKAEVDKLLSQEALCKEQVIDLTDQLDHLRSKITNFSLDHRTNQDRIASQDASHKLEVAKLSSREALCKEQVADLTAQLKHLRDEMDNLSHDHKDLLGRSTEDQEKLDKVTRDLDATCKQAADTKCSQLAKDQLDTLTRDLEAAQEQIASIRNSHFTKDQAAQGQLEKRTQALEAAQKRVAELESSKSIKDQATQCQLDKLTQNQETAQKFQAKQLQEDKVIHHVRLRQNLDHTRKQCSELQRENANQRSPYEAREHASKAELSKVTPDLGNANQRCRELKSAQSTHASELEKTFTGLEQDLDAANQRISTLTADLKAERGHSHDVDLRVAGIQSSQKEVTVLEGNLCVAKQQIITLTDELTAAKEHSHNVGTPGSKQVQELESNITAWDEHLDRDEDKIAWRDVARLKARVAELEKELVDSQVAYEKETKETDARIDPILQLAEPQASTSAPTQSSNLVESKHSSHTSVTSSEKRIKTSESTNTDTIDLTSSDTEHGKAKVQGLVPNAADQTKFTLIAQSDLPEAIQEKINGWIRKLDVYPVKTGMSPRLIAGNKVETTCAVRRLHKGSSTWIDNNLDRACMDCSTKGYPCIVIRTTGPILLPLYHLQGLPSSDPEYWIKSTK